MFHTLSLPDNIVCFNEWNVHCCLILFSCTVYFIQGNYLPCHVIFHSTLPIEPQLGCEPTLSLSCLILCFPNLLCFFLVCLCEYGITIDSWNTCMYSLTFQYLICEKQIWLQYNFVYSNRLTSMNMIYIFSMITLTWLICNLQIKYNLSRYNHWLSIGQCASFVTFKCIAVGWCLDVITFFKTMAFLGFCWSWKVWLRQSSCYHLSSWWGDNIQETISHEQALPVCSFQRTHTIQWWWAKKLQFVF